MPLALRYALLTLRYVAAAVVALWLAMMHLPSIILITWGLAIGEGGDDVPYWVAKLGFHAVAVGMGTVLVLVLLFAFRPRRRER